MEYNEASIVFNIRAQEVIIKVLIFFIAFATGFIFLISAGHGLTSDDSQYDTLAWNLASGHGYSLDSHQPYGATNLREPGYIVFLYLIYKIFGHNVQIAYFIQILLFSLSCIFVFFITKKIFNEQIAKYAAILTAICPTLANYAVYLYSESFFIFLLTFSIFALIYAKNSRSLYWYAFSGLLLGMVVLCKAVMLFFIVPAIFYLYSNNGRLKIILLVSVFCMAVIPWMFRNYYIFGTFNLASRGEMNLLIRAYKTDYCFQDIKKTITYSYSEHLGSKFFPNPTAMRARDVLFQEDYRVYNRYSELVKEGKSSSEISKIITQEALYKIKEHPIKYLLQTPVELFRLMLFMYLPALWEKNIVDRFIDIQGGLSFLSIIRGIYRSSSFIVLLLAFVGMYARRMYWKKDFIILAVILYINFIYSVLNAHSRYSIPLIPFYLMFASVGIMAILKRRVD